MRTYGEALLRQCLIDSVSSSRRAILPSVLKIVCQRACAAPGISCKISTSHRFFMILVTSRMSHPDIDDAGAAHFDTFDEERQNEYFDFLLRC